MFGQTSSWAVFRRTKIITRQKDNHIWQLFINTSQLNLQQAIYEKHINNKFIYKYIYKTKVLYRGGVLGWGLKSILDGEKVYARRVKAIEDSHEDHYAYKISSLLHKLLKSDELFCLAGNICYEINSPHLYKHILRPILQSPWKV